MYSLRGNTPSNETFTHMNREFNHYVNNNCFASQSETNNAPSKHVIKIHMKLSLRSKQSKRWAKRHVFAQTVNFA